MGKRKRKRARRNSWYFLKTISVAGTTLKYGLTWICFGSRKSGRELRMRGEIPSAGSQVDDWCQNLYEM